MSASPNSSVNPANSNSKNASQSQEHYARLIDGLDDGFLLVELIFNQEGDVIDARFLEANAAYERQTGTKVSDVIGKRIKEIAPTMEQYWFNHASKAAKAGKTIHYENYNQDTNRYYDTQFIPLPASQMGILFRDVTERKRTEGALHKKQQELNCILDSSPTIIFYKDKEGKFIQANRAFAEALKVPKEELLGKTVFDLYSAELAQAMTNDDFAVLESKRPKLEIVEPYESPAGLRWIRTDKIPSLDEDGTVTGLIGFSEDITERRKAEVALKESEHRYNLIFDSMADGFTLVEPIYEEGKLADLRYLEMNPANLRFIGKSRDQIVGRRMKEVLRRSEDYWFELYDKVDKTGKPVSFEQYVKTLDRYYEIYIWKTSENQFAAISTDITERKHLEKQLHEKERMAAIGQTAGMVGHDLRNPLQSIVGEVYLARHELKMLPESDQKNYLQESIQTIAEQIDYMDKIVSDLQTFVKPVEPQLRIVKLKPLITALLAKINVAEGIETSTQVDDTLIVEADPQLLKRVLINLITNAMQAMPEGGQLTIKAQDSSQGQVQILVGDTGVGIPEEVKPKIFMPLFTTKSKGQGFGLAVCKRVIEAQGGAISFESELGKGTKFIVNLPLKQ